MFAPLTPAPLPPPTSSRKVPASCGRGERGWNSASDCAGPQLLPPDFFHLLSDAHLLASTDSAFERAAALVQGWTSRTEVGIHGAIAIDARELARPSSGPQGSGSAGSVRAFLRPPR